MKQLIRVFPRRNSFTPKDAFAFVGDPPLFRPPADEVHVSVTFSWDVEEGKRLAQAWGQYYKKVKLGGPAFDDPGSSFTPGRYVRRGVVFTSRGCSSRCGFCLVRHREGMLREIANFTEGHIIQDNNLLQCSRHHILRVMAMLRKQRRVSFKGGLDARLFSDWFSDELRSLRLDEIFLACDYPAALEPLERALAKLEWMGRGKDGLLRHVYCYVLLAYKGQRMEEAEAQLRSVYMVGALPFAQLYQPPDKWIVYSPEWRRLARTWSRPAATKAYMRQYKGSPDD